MPVPGASIGSLSCWAPFESHLLQFSPSYKGLLKGCEKGRGSHCQMKPPPCQATTGSADHLPLTKQVAGCRYQGPIGSWRDLGNTRHRLPQEALQKTQQEALSPAFFVGWRCFQQKCHEIIHTITKRVRSIPKNYLRYVWSDTLSASPSQGKRQIAVMRASVHVLIRSGLQEAHMELTY